MKRLFVFSTILYLTTQLGWCQLSVQPSHAGLNRLESIVNSLVGRGIEVSNITSNRPSGSPMYGTFSEPSGTLGIYKGLLMTTGIVQNARGPNSAEDKSSDLNLPGDATLSALVMDATYDACVIEFDIKTNSSGIRFNYIFASEEYLEYVGTPYNDVFAFLISGPGITGQRNIALVPSTTTPVAINNVNNISNNSYYIDNGDGVNTGGTLLQYDGYTVRLMAEATVIPCETYHLKLAIADVSDGGYDSGVFIEAGSLSGTEGIMIGGLLAPDVMDVCPSDLPITLQAGITSVPNYIWTKDNVQVSTGNQFYSVTEGGMYRVKAFIQPSCFWTDSILFNIPEDFDLVVSPDTGVCAGGSTRLEVVPSRNEAYTYRWSPIAGLDDYMSPTPFATVSSPTVFKVVVNNRCYSDSAEVEVQIYPPPASQAYKDTIICYGGTAALHADYVNSYQYHWRPTSTVSNPLIHNPNANPLANTDYIVNINNRGCAKEDTVHVIVREEVKAGILLPVKDGEVPWKVKLRNTSTGAVDYTWYMNGFDSTKILEPTFDVTEENNYTIVLKAINDLGCIDYDTIQILAYKLFIPNLITPNGDGKNDSFHITGLGENFDLEVYNRWGDRVYKKSNYRNEWNGDGLSDGIYYFMIYDPYREKDYRGWVQLLR